MTIPVVTVACERTEVLLLHAPYPGRLKFEGPPSSLLHAVSVFAHRLAARDQIERLGLLDPGVPSASYREDLARFLRSENLRVLCISTTNAAIEETMAAVALARVLRGDELLIIVGGPHEDDCDEKVATRVPGVDLSIGGDAEFVLDFVLQSYLARVERPQSFLRWLEKALPKEPLRGRVAVTSPLWGTMVLDLQPIAAANLLPPVWTTKKVRFSVFEAGHTLPILVSRGCSYGKCTFCAEPNQAGARVVREDFDWLRELVASNPGAAVYFQDSIFPRGEAIERKLLPLLRELGVEWGAQVYMRALSRPWLELLRTHGCSYLYTGLESASAEILAAIGKRHLNREVALERLVWMRDLGFKVGISLMFGAISLDGRCLETEETVAATLALTDEIRALGVRVTGFYPNVLTVLSGTELERSLRRRGIVLDYYAMPRCAEFEGFEDGGVGYNFRTIPGIEAARGDLALQEKVFGPWGSPVQTHRA